METCFRHCTSLFNFPCNSYFYNALLFFNGTAVLFSVQFLLTAFPEVENFSFQTQKSRSTMTYFMPMRFCLFVQYQIILLNALLFCNDTTAKSICKK